MGIYMYVNSLKKKKKNSGLGWTSQGSSPIILSSLINRINRLLALFFFSPHKDYFLHLSSIIIKYTDDRTTYPVGGGEKPSSLNTINGRAHIVGNL